MKYLLDTCIVGRTDPLFAAQAIAMGAVCVTDNVRHFLRVSGLIVENWLQPD